MLKLFNYTGSPTVNLQTTGK